MPIKIHVTHPLRNPTMGMKEDDELLLVFTDADTGDPFDNGALDGTYKIGNVQENWMDLMEQA